jgi:uncharacterized membrane protein YdjX (TVP38/TMEM64 family)
VHNSKQAAHSTLRYVVRHINCDYASEATHGKPNYQKIKLAARKQFELVSKMVLCVPAIPTSALKMRFHGLPGITIVNT